jgi:hypothetical protein
MGLLDRVTNPLNKPKLGKVADSAPAETVAKAGGGKGFQRAPKIKLRPEEMKRTNQLTDREKLVGYVVAAVEAVVVVFVARKGGINKDDAISIPLMIVVLALFAVCVRFTNRMGVTLAATGAVAMWIARFPIDIVFAYGIMGYMLYLSMASMKSRQKIMAERAAAGDYTDGMAEARKAKANPKPDYAATDAAGRALAAKSSRYTPPKATKK